MHRCAMRGSAGPPIRRKLLPRLCEFSLGVNSTVCPLMCPDWFDRTGDFLSKLCVLGAWVDPNMNAQALGMDCVNPVPDDVCNGTQCVNVGAPRRRLRRQIGTSSHAGCDRLEARSLASFE